VKGEGEEGEKRGKMMMWLRKRGEVIY